MDSNELKEILEKHEKWLKLEGGERINLYNANLCDVDLHGAILRDAILRSANLYGANLRGANLHSAILYNANLHNADLSNANLRCADLCCADLYNVDLRSADLCGADLRGANLFNVDLRDANLRNADLRGADLRNADLHGAKNISSIPMACPDSGAFTAWKKAHGHIVKLLIPEDARRSSATGWKCRCDKAIVVAIETVDGKPAELDEIASDYNYTFIYKVGETVTEPKFCEDRFKECSEGIHFFINRQEAVDYEI